MTDPLQRRNELLADLRRAAALPGSAPYDNYRPINVPARLCGMTLYQSVCELHPHISGAQWREWFRQGHILLDDQPMPMERVVRGGEQFQHLFPATVEPDVNASIEILWEDEALVAVNKPAPLPVHPSGRFNRNTLTGLLKVAYGAERLRVVHRLDANTTGLILLARSRQSATRLSQQFEHDRIDKRYLVRCHGHPDQDGFACQAPIGRRPTVGGSREVASGGRPAETRFQVLKRCDDGSSLLEARPLTGRTNQIRIHLWTMGHAVVGDPAYRVNRELAAQQTLQVDDPPMCLHASSLSLKHPMTGEALELAAPDPNWKYPR